MAYVVTDKCTKCMSCTQVCPVSCIHPTDGEAGFAQATQVFVNPADCISCGACAGECPVEAIGAEEDLPADKKAFIKANADFFG